MTDEQRKELKDFFGDSPAVIFAETVGTIHADTDDAYFDGYAVYLLYERIVYEIFGDEILYGEDRREVLAEIFKAALMCPDDNESIEGNFKTPTVEITWSH